MSIFNSLCNKCSSVSACTLSALCFIVWFLFIFFACTVIFCNNLLASVTLNCAAPVKLAVAAADNLNALLNHSQSALIAEPAATLPLPLGLVLVPLQTLPPFRALKTQAVVLDAVIRRVLQVNELRPGDAPKSVRNGPSVVRAVPSPRRLLVHFELLRLPVLHF